MNNEMDDFSSKPGFPNAYGLVGSEANKLNQKNTPFVNDTGNYFQAGKTFFG